MAKNQKSYTPEFKQQIVDLHCQAGKGVTELSNEYGIPKGTVSTWIKNLAPVAAMPLILSSLIEIFLNLLNHAIILGFYQFFLFSWLAPI